MRQLLSVYERTYDGRFPVVCMDEASKQLIGEISAPAPLKPGQAARQDYEYVRHGTANQFVFCEPLSGWRHVEVRSSRTMRDWAYAIQTLVEVHYPNAEKIALVLDNLNTHTGASLYKTFAPAQAKQLLDGCNSDIAGITV